VRNLAGIKELFRRIGERFYWGKNYWRSRLQSTHYDLVGLIRIPVLIIALIYSYRTPLFWLILYLALDTIKIICYVRYKDNIPRSSSLSFIRTKTELDELIVKKSILTNEVERLEDKKEIEKTITADFEKIEGIEIDIDLLNNCLREVTDNITKKEEQLASQMSNISNSFKGD